ncbi:TPA: hypothetical protein J7111_004624 [Escherichia coli]|uniref:Uncharacterized protein n=1 Tax=Escherichia coli TaxID=562 RepID=A0A1B2RBJ1_ECOLX|nr:hypothetical protein [Escherichia coli]AOB42030.1 hypothetical protein [Escherichia coli]HAZ7915601.1 hypothetical protein [Escherichia coli]
MNDDKPDLYALRLKAVISFMESLRKIRLRATVVLAIVVMGNPVIQSIGTDLTGWMASLAWWLTVVFGSLCLTIIVGATVMLWRLEKERDRAFCGRPGKW